MLSSVQDRNYYIESQFIIYIEIHSFLQRSLMGRGEIKARKNFTITKDEISFKVCENVANVAKYLVY